MTSSPDVKVSAPSDSMPSPRSGMLERGDSSAADRLSDSQLLEQFNNCQDPTYFETLMSRHGPMVLGVCRRLVDDRQGAEDAFQETFLVLVCRARSISQPELLANWLYGVASRIARKAKSRQLRQRYHEKQVPPPPMTNPLEEADRRDLRAVLSAEMSRLPEKYRAPLFLCYWEGKTNAEAARELGCPSGSMSWRLARGREMLRHRLSRRGN
jgi:RNA polymerase sigma factor (sigma-70 family)